MLNSNALASDLKGIFDDVLEPSLESAIRSMNGEETEAGIEKAKTFAKNFTEMVSKPLGDRIAASIDHYLKSACIFGTILTAGSPVAQTAVIPPGTPAGMAIAGKVPNTLGMM